MDAKELALESWTLARPKMVAELKKMGMLEEALEKAEDLAGELISALVSRGVPFEIARERGPGKFIFLPSEKEQPRLSPGTKESSIDMGLGLAITYGIVEDYGGDIQLTSREGQGTTFKLSFAAT